MARVGQVREGARAPAAAKAPKPQTVGDITIVTDADGRTYGLRKLKPSERYSLSEAVEAATMSASMQLITAASVISIGEEGLPLISSKPELLARLDEIGDDGLAAVTPVVLKMYGVELDKEAIEAAKKLTRDPEFYQVMALIKNGVSEEIAWSLSPSERLARMVVFGQLDGGEFDWSRLCWKEAK